jgi:hypothetical protein
MWEWITGLFQAGETPSPTAVKRAEKARADAAREVAKLTEDNGRQARRIAALEDEIKLRDQRLTVLAETVEMQRAFISKWQAQFEHGRARALSGIPTVGEE